MGKSERRKVTIIFEAYVDDQSRELKENIEACFVGGSIYGEIKVFSEEYE